MFKAILIAINALTAFISFNLGMDWINFGYGLNPVIAFPVALLAFLAACFIGQYIDMVNAEIDRAADAMEKMAHWD